MAGPRAMAVPLPERLLLAVGRVLARVPSPWAMGLLGSLAAAVPAPRGAAWRGAARREVWRARGEALWAGRRSRVAFCRRLSFEGWEHLHHAVARGREVIFVGLRPAGWEFALLALGRYGSPVTLATVEAEDVLLLADHLRVGNVVPAEAFCREADFVSAAFLGTAREEEVPPQLEAAVVAGAAVVPLFACREGKGWRVNVWQSAVFEERTTSKKEQALQWVHRICMRAVEAEARRLPDRWNWQRRS